MNSLYSYEKTESSSILFTHRSSQKVSSNMSLSMCYVKWFAVLFSFAGAIIRFVLYLSGGTSYQTHACSPKFFRKIVYIDTLSELAQHVPLTQIDIPSTVYRYAS